MNTRRCKCSGLAFLILIGFSLIAEAAHLGHFTEGAVPKGYLYFAIFFSLFVELLNLRLRKAQKPVQLHGYGETAKKRGLLDEDLLDTGNGATNKRPRITTKGATMTHNDIHLNLDRRYRIFRPGNDRTECDPRPDRTDCPGQTTQKRRSGAVGTTPPW
jgi:hypothetical protein